jgi:preprotein translocase subunit SecG
MRRTILSRTTLVVAAVLLATVVLLGVAKNTVVSHPEKYETREKHAHSQGEQS